MKAVHLIRARIAVSGALALVTAVFAAFSVSPAAAGTAAAHAPADVVCNPLAAESGPFDGLARLAATAPARGADELREPELGQTAVEAPRAKRKPSGGIVVPTYVHVITPDGVTGNVSLKKIKEQITVLDLTFAGFYGGYSTGFDFDLADVSRTVNAAWFYAGPGTDEEHAMKQALRRGGANALNLYLTTAGPYLGWAYFPSILDTSEAYLDGIVVDWESLPGVSDKYEGKYDLGYTATHEAGHWLNLYHTFEGACGAVGDRVADTPAELTPTSGCPEGKDSCPGQPGLDPIHNYMDYSYDSCYTEFTQGQGTRMLDAWIYWRA